MPLKQRCQRQPPDIRCRCSDELKAKFAGPSALPRSGESGKNIHCLLLSSSDAAAANLTQAKRSRMLSGLPPVEGSGFDFCASIRSGFVRIVGLLTPLAATLSLAEYLQVCTERYTACLDSLEEIHRIPGVIATARFHHLKFDANGRPRWKDLAKNLAYHLLSYCFSVQRRNEARTDVELMELRHEARQFFRDTDCSGEAGEMLLFFLLEAVLQAPQMVAKISLKTNSALETFGSDGIHMKWDPVDGILDLYFGEAKLYQDFSSSVSETVKSIEGFHARNLEEFELRMVTRHFKHAEGPMKNAILEYVKRGTAWETVRINHACLLGYDWNAYAGLPTDKSHLMAAEFRNLYQSNLPRIRSVLNRRFDCFREKQLRFEIFVLPFTSVNDFREAFLNAL